MPDPVPSLSAGSWRRVAERLESEKVGAERELAECKEALEKAHTHIGVLASVLPADLVPKYKERLAALNAEARPATAEPDDPNPERSSPNPTRSADRGVS